LGEYLNLFAACVLLVLLFCGGWHFWINYFWYFNKLINFWFFNIV
jgi:NADH:ubiquinone oxidoreductase subunit H